MSLPQLLLALAEQNVAIGKSVNFTVKKYTQINRTLILCRFLAIYKIGNKITQHNLVGVAGEIQMS